MKYMTFIFENEAVRNNVASKEALIDLASRNIINHNVVTEAFVFENLSHFVTGCESIEQVYTKIRDFVIGENITAYNQLSQILSDTELNDEDKMTCLKEVVVPATASPGVGDVSAAADAPFNVQSAVEAAKTKAKDALGAARQMQQNTVEAAKASGQAAMQQVQAHPYVAGAVGAGLAGLGAYGAYRAMKNRKAAAAA